ncbi:hypothetical protein LguiA_024796 [Lonicera macranthoides]
MNGASFYERANKELDLAVYYNNFNSSWLYKEENIVKRRKVKKSVVMGQWSLVSGKCYPLERCFGELNEEVGGSNKMPHWLQEAVSASVRTMVPNLPLTISAIARSFAGRSGRTVPSSNVHIKKPFLLN